MRGSVRSQHPSERRAVSRGHVIIHLVDVVIRRGRLLSGQEGRLSFYSYTLAGHCIFKRSTDPGRHPAATG